MTRKPINKEINYFYHAVDHAGYISAKLILSEYNNMKTE